MGKRFITVNEAARIKECSRQAIHGAIKSKRLLAWPRQVTKTEWEVDVKSLAKLVINSNMKRNGRTPRRYCTEASGGCGSEVTSTDIEAGYCTNCKREL